MEFGQRALGHRSILADARFIESKKFTFPIFADKDKSIYNLFATKYIPRNYLIDSNGKVIYASTGFSEKEFEELKATIDKHLIK
jgi:peroxiredoxin